MKRFVMGAPAEPRPPIEMSMSAREALAIVDLIEGKGGDPDVLKKAASTLKGALARWRYEEAA